MTLETPSPLNSLLSLPDADRQAWIADLTPAEAEALVYDWPFWARHNQLAPPGNWLVWLVLAGRGFGKTRTGAEWIRDRVESGVARRLAFVRLLIGGMMNNPVDQLGAMRDLGALPDDTDLEAVANEGAGTLD